METHGKKQQQQKKQSQMTREYTIREGITVEAGNALQPGLVTCADRPQRSTYMAHDNISTHPQRHTAPSLELRQRCWQDHELGTRSEHRQECQVWQAF